MKLRRRMILLAAAVAAMVLLAAGAIASGPPDENWGDCPSGGTHHWIGNYYAGEPTCTSGADVSWYCDKCYQDRVSTVPALGHDWGPWNTVNEPTCTETGEQVRSCTRCGEREMGTIPALGHDWHEETVANVPPTCTEDGYRDYHNVCSRCGAATETMRDDLPALGHDWGPWKTSLEPTCEEKGKRHHTCKRCNWTGGGSIAALGHDWDDGVVTRVPTPEKPGEMTYTCKRDPSHTYTVEIPYDGGSVPPPTEKPDPDPVPVPDPEGEVALTLTAEMTGTIKSAYHEGEQIYYKLTLTNDGKENVSFPIVSQRWVEQDSFVKAHSDSYAVIAPGASYSFYDSDYIIHDDVLNGKVTFEYAGEATRESDGAKVYSNKATLTWLTEDEEPEPDAQYSLKLEVYKTNPKTEYTLDGAGYTEEIPYFAIVTNTSNVPVRFRDVRVILNGIMGGTISEPEQYLMPDDQYSFYIYGTVMHESQAAPGTETATAYGVATLSFTAVCCDADSGDPVCDSNTVDLDHTLLKEIPPWVPDFSSVSIEKVETSSHPNPLGYMLNETITYDIIVTNTGSVPISSLEVHDSLYDDGGGSDVIAVLTDLKPAESAVVGFSHVVTQDDVNAGWVYNTATATWMDLSIDMNKSATSLTVQSPTTAEPIPGGLEIVKSVTSKPDNGVYYTPGETITFHIAITNTMDFDINDIWTYDTHNAPVYVGTLLPHATYEWSYDYIATDHPDADMGYVSNIAYADGFAPDGFKSAVSNEVTVPVHRDPPKEAALKLTKEESSKPANGSYYVLDEEIVYTITAENIGKTVLYDICLFDSLDCPPVEYAHFGILSPGEKQSATYTYKVTQADVDAGYVENWAIADYWAEGDSSKWYSEYAGPVISPTKEGPIIRKKTLTPGKDDSCRLTLKGAGSFTLTEEQHYCAEHKQAEEQVSALTAAAVTEADQAAAWQQGVSIWRAALEAEYEDIMKAAEGAARLALLEEQTAFDKYIGTLSTMLRELYPDDPALVSRTICEALERECTELCFLRSNAGQARPDSMFSGRYKDIADDTAAEKCVKALGPTRTGDILITRSLCAEHGKLQNTVIYLAKGAVNRTAAEDAFLRTRRVWQSSLDQATNAKCRATEGDAQTAVVQFRMAFDKLLEKEADLLNRLYPSNPEIVAEVISNMVRNQLITLCGIW